ncbi:MAG: NADH-quinone oxidoreductase subunit A [Paludibacteraceae bacterium]|nr:NADH-quinone oxidoreductase subunit A [Paludibacteraceae bacterium]
MNESFLVVALVTAVVMVVGGSVIALLIAPRSKNEQKGDPYECGVVSRGTTWMPFKVGYYLFAILFLMFDVETIYLFPWAVVTRTLGIGGLAVVGVFLAILALGLAYAWKKGALEWK